MTVRIRPARASLTGRASNGEARPDNQLAFLDQAFFAGHRAAGQKEVVQAVWIYEHPIDFDGLRRFHDNLGYGLLGRRIECSPLPFARHRWISDRGPSDIDIAECARPRAEVSDWADERSQLHVDAEGGPGWHLGVLPLTDGSTAVSLVLSHYLLDGLGLVIALIEAIQGNRRDLGYPPPLSRTRRRALVQDARQIAGGVPEVARALVAGAKLARKQARQRDGARAPASPPAALRGGDGDDPVVLPGITMYIDLNDWDARAKALGGTSSTLAAGLAAKLGDRMGRRRASDGAVAVQLIMSDRTEGDARAIAVNSARVYVDPARVTTDLRDTRADIKQALSGLRETPDESSQLASLIPFTPRRTLKRLADAALADPDRPVVCSNLGDLGGLVIRADGTDAEYAYSRPTRQRATRQWLERIGGQLYVLTFRIPGRIVVNLVAYQPGAENTKPALRELAARALAEFDLTAEID
ncbi:MAG TPA: hypothetical protein VGI81_02940 [Tepidisphaeraceae bacterium]